MKKKKISERLTATQRAEIKALEVMPDEQMDTQNIPEIINWKGVRRGNQ